MTFQIKKIYFIAYNIYRKLGSSTYNNFIACNKYLQQTWYLYDK